MVTFTNRHGLPAPLFALLGREQYSRGASRRSVTQLIDSPRLTALKERHGKDDAIEIDISERIWALFGTAVHKLIEDGLPHSDWVLAEERLFLEVAGWQISGAVDLQEIDDGVNLIDWKCCSVWSVLKDKPEWHKQLNLLAYLVEKTKGVKVKGLQIGALLRDWSRAEADRNPDYPQSPFHMHDIPLWTMEAREGYAEMRVHLHQQAEMQLAMDEEMPSCTPEEMWVKGEAWAVFKPGNKRASKVFEQEADAAAFSAMHPGSTVEHRPGDRLRCSRYCEVAGFCSLAPLDAFGM